MAERFFRLSFVGKLSVVIALVGVLIGCLIGGRSILHRQQAASPFAQEAPPADADMQGGHYSVQITQSQWVPEWLSASSIFTGVVQIAAEHGHTYVVRGDLRITDSSGNLVRSWAEMKKVTIPHHGGGAGQATVTFTWTWNGTDGTGQPVPEGPYSYEFKARFRAKSDSRAGSIGVDRTGPTITIDQPQGEINGTSVPVSISWSDSPSGIDSSTGEVKLDGSVVSGLTITESGATGTIDGVTEGPHAITATVKDLAGNEGSASGAFTVKLTGPVEQRTSIVGSVADSSGAAMADVTVSSPGASAAATSDSEGKFLLQMTSGGTHWLTFEKSGYIPVQRPAEVTEGQHFNIGEVRMVAQDSQVTTIGPEGGTATNSSGDIELVVPAGALSTSADIRLTHIPTSKELPGPLNASDNVQYPISYIFCVYLEPFGTAFNQPATLRYPNRWGFPAGHRIPTAWWDEQANKWVPDGGSMTVTSDGSTIERQVSAFEVSGQQLRSGRTRGTATTQQQEAPRGVAVDSNGGNGGNGSSQTPQNGSRPDSCHPGSVIRLGSSTLQKNITLPAVTAPGIGASLNFVYRSETAYPSGLINTTTWAGADSASMVDWRYAVQINGQRKEVVFRPKTGTSDLRFFWDGLNGEGSPSSTGLYDYSAEILTRYPGYYTNEQTWGGMPTGLTSAPSQEPVEKRNVLKEPFALINAVTSPYGAGWHLSGMLQLYPQPDGRVLLVEGGSPASVYYPQLNYARLSEGASIASVRNEGYFGQGDKRNMIGYYGTGAKIAGVPSEIDYQDGFLFNSSSGPYDWVVVDLGQERQVQTLGLSFNPVLSPQAVITVPIFQIYTSLDNETWSIWSEAYEETVEGVMRTKLSSPYLASHAQPESVRYIKYMAQPPFERGVSAQTLIFRLLALGPSDRYGTGPNGQDEAYPRLQRVQPDGWELSERDGTKFVFDAAGLLQTAKDLHDNTTSYSWEEGRLSRLTDAAGGVTTFTYSNGKLSQVTDSAGRVTHFSVDSSGNLTGVTMPDSSSTSFGYDGRHLLTGATDPRGQVTSYTWDASYPLLRSTVRPGGGETSFDLGSFAGLINGLNGTEANPADAPGMETELKATDALGRIITYKWQPYESDASAVPMNLQRIIDPAGRETKRYLHPRMDGVEALQIEPDGSKMRNTYDADEGLFVVKVEDFSEVEYYRRKAQYTYEPVFKKIATSTDIGGHVTSYGYNEKGDLDSTTDPTGYVTSMAYDAKGQLETVTDAESAVTRYEYDARGNRTKTTDPLNRVTVMTYDGAGNMTSLTDPASKVTRWEHDQVGRVTKVTDPAGGETRYVYEPGGACTSGCGSGGGSSGLLTSITDAAGHVTTFEYDAAGRMTAIINPLGTRKEYTYDLAGRLTKFKNGRGQEILYQYDVSNNLVKKTLPDEGDVDYTFDINNRMTQVIDADSILRYGYAPYTGFQNTAPGHSDVALKGMKTYELFGLEGDTRYERQWPGTLLYVAGESTEGWPNAVDFIVQRNMYLDLPGGGTREMRNRYFYDAAHRLTNSDAGPSYAPVYYTYDRVGRVLSRSIENYAHLSAAYQYDAAGQLLHITHRGWLGSAYWQEDFGYQYDLAGNRSSMTDPQGTHGFGYDDRYQLTSATHPTDPTESFGYDSAGNRTTSHISPSYTYNAANQLLEDAEFNYSFDLDGNCTGKVSKLDGTRHEYVFNSENRMTGYRKYDGTGTLVTTAGYVCDAIGRRIAKDVNGTLTKYVYHEEDIWDVIHADGLHESFGHAPGIDDPMYVWYWRPGDVYDGAFMDTWTYYFVTDALGSVRQHRLYAPYQAGILTTSLVYDSFGQILSPATFEDSTVRYSFTGRELDTETGLMNLRARYYDPRAGRFTSEDPIGFDADDNFYRYVRNSPTNHADPFGLVPSVPPGMNPGSPGLNLCKDKGPEWTSLFWKDTTFNPLANPEAWSTFEHSFMRKCKAVNKGSEPVCRKTETVCRVVGGVNAPVPTGLCQCCSKTYRDDTCCPAAGGD